MKKIFSLIISTLILISTAYAVPIYEYKNEEIIYDGVKHTTYRRLYGDRNLKFDVIEADLTKEHLKFELLKSEKGADILDTVKNLSDTKSNTIVASNADFFSVHSGNKGFSLGLEIKDSKLLQSPVNTTEMAGAFLEDNSLSLSYLTFNRMLVAPNGAYLEIRHTNKHTSYYGDLLLYTSDFNNGMSPAPGGEVVEMVVSNSKVVEFRRNMPPVEIPKDGYVLVISEGSSMFLGNNFNIDDTVKIDLYATPSLENTDIAFGGGTLLIKEGEIAPKTHNVSGYNPRTAIGTDITGKKIYIVTVDGRQKSSKGATLNELAQIMLEIGCYNALNLDGGGSTNLVAKTPFNSETHSINSPTENRKVINAIGITSSAYPSTPALVKLNISDDIVYIDDSITFEARIFDKYLNPVWNGETPDITVSSGKIYENTYYPTQGGNIKLTAKYKKFEDERIIKVIENIASIKLNNTLSLKPNESEKLHITVFDKDGNFCKVNNFTNFNISSINPETVSYSNGTIYAHKTGIAYIKVEKDNAVSYLKIIVGNPGISPYTDSFETINATFTSYPEEHVTGNYEISAEQSTSGVSSGKLSYDFTAEDYNGTMAAYMVYDSIPITDYADSVSFDVYSEDDKENLQIKVQFTDGKGNEAYRLIAADSIKAGWQNIVLKIPDTAIWPLNLTRIYIVQPETANKTSGVVYFDNLNVIIKEKELIDINNNFNSTTYKNTHSGDGIIFKIAGVADAPTTIFDKVAYQNLLRDINNADIYALLGKFNYTESHGNNTPLDTSKFSAISKYNSTFITLTTEKGSIRASSPSQWELLKDTLNTTEDNIFILINGYIDTDTFEGTTFIDLMNDTGKPVFVITNASQNSLNKYGNVHLFELCDTADGITLEDKLNSANLIEFNISDTNVSYKFKKLWK